MQSITKHITKCLIAGIVALLPIAALVLTVVQLEHMLSTGWLKSQAVYFPGLGLIVAALIIYAIGLTVTTFLGKWLWRTMDQVLDRMPLFGGLYRTLKQILGYGEGKDAMFKQVVLVPTGKSDGVELGLVTNQVLDGAGQTQLMIFIPGSPNPATGRLLMLQPQQVQVINMTVNDAFKSLVSAGSTAVPMSEAK
ncbi:MAG: DUF502 domain-containing protein [Phycisphaeraceae bacterium]